MKDWFNKLHVWSLKWANTKWGAWGLFFCAFADACCLPLPTPMFFIALALLNITKAYHYALFGTLGSLLGAIVGYSIGHFAWLNASGDFTGFAQFVFNHLPGFTEPVYNKIQFLFAKWDFWILFVASLIPLPYKIFSISSGVFDVNIFMFCVATFVSQGIKFYLLALLAVKLGPNVKNILAFKFKPIAIMTTACVAIVVIIKKVF
jgi:membrane protein YqaA with SNARE-associated domain